MDVVEGHLFLFRSRCGSKLKGLYYEEQSFTLWYRRLEMRILMKLIRQLHYLDQGIANIEIAFC